MGGIFEVVSKAKNVFDKEAKNLKKEMESLREFQSQFENLIQNFKLVERKTTSIRYKTGSLFLKECFEYLTSSPDEVIHLVTGIELSQEVYLLDRLEKVKFRATVVGARADVKSVFQKMVEIDETFGHLLLGVFHSHPFRGIAGTSPSGIDRKLQENLEKSGYRTIQAIFSQDGYIRFFSNEIPFEIEVYGKGIEKIKEDGKEKIFKLAKARV